MKKNTNLKKIALMGIVGGALLGQVNAAEPQNDYRGSQNNTADAMKSTMQNSNKIMTEQELLSKLNTEGKATYQNLSKEGRAMALQLANQSCKGQNGCKGMNSCKTKENACAGKGGCKGTSKGAFDDKNTAVKVAAEKMAQKRSTMMNGN